MNDKKINRRITITLIVTITMIFVSLGTLFVTLINMGYIDVKINTAVNQSVETEVEKKISSLNLDEEIESVVIEAINSLDIDSIIDEKVSQISVINGEDGVTTIVEKEPDYSIISKMVSEAVSVKIGNLNITSGVDGTNGQTPVLRCNTKKNRWEVTYDSGATYRIVLDEDNNTVPCVLTGE